MIFGGHGEALYASTRRVMLVRAVSYRWIKIFVFFRRSLFAPSSFSAPFLKANILKDRICTSDENISLARSTIWRKVGNLRWLVPNALSLLKDKTCHSLLIRARAFDIYCRVFFIEMMKMKQCFFRNKQLILLLSSHQYIIECSRHSLRFA